jgi:hypothetical protein
MTLAIHGVHFIEVGRDEGNCEPGMSHRQMCLNESKQLHELEFKLAMVYRE